MAITTLNEWFDGVGAPVTGERFVGKRRQQLATYICKQFLVPKTGTNMMMNGLPRIGKTSILMEAMRLYEMEEKSTQVNKVVCFIDMLKYQSYSPAELYYSIVDNVYSSLPQNVINDNVELQDCYNWLSERIDNSPSIARVTSKVQDFFIYCKDAGLSIRLIFDEFDATLSVFRRPDSSIDTYGLGSFQGLLRDFITLGSQYDVKAFFTSRNLLEEIEPENAGGSTLSGVCGPTRTLQLFDKDEQNEYWSTLKKIDTQNVIDQSFKDAVMYYAGGYPKLMNVAASLLVNNESSILSDSIIQEYNRIVKMLDVKVNLKEISDTSLKDTLLQLTIGPQHSISFPQVQRLTRYGVISQNEDSSYETFCPFFLEYLKYLSVHVSVWDVIGSFERSMRLVIAKYLDSIGDSEYCITSAVIKDNFKKALLDRRLKDKKIGSASSDSLLDYLYIGEYILFVENGWSNWFSKVFTNYSLEQCKTVFAAIASTRNPNMHYRPISPEDKLLVTKYVNNIVGHITTFLQNNS